MEYINLEDAGLIPARAGTTIQGMVDWVRMRAHPRSRGDHAVSLI